MAARSVKLVLWLLVFGYPSLESSASPPQNTSPAVHRFSTLKEFRDFVALYFPPGTFKKPEGSSDDSRADVLALYLSDIGEPPLVRTDNYSEPHAYRLIWTAFPSGVTVVIRLQIYSAGTARVFVEKTPFDKTTLLLTKQSTVSAEAVNRFLECVKRGDFWQLPTQEHEPRVVDGSYWVLEGVRDGNYHLVYRRAPELNPGAFTDIGRNLARDLAGLGDFVNIPPGDGSAPVRRQVKKP